MRPPCDWCIVDLRVSPTIKRKRLAIVMVSFLEHPTAVHVIGWAAASAKDLISDEAKFITGISVSKIGYEWQIRFELESE